MELVIRKMENIIKDFIYKKKFDNLETRCFHQNVVVTDPVITITNRFYDKCFVCKDYSNCEYYTPMNKIKK